MVMIDGDDNDNDVGDENDDCDENLAMVEMNGGGDK